MSLHDTEILLHDGRVMKVEKMADEIHRFRHFAEPRVTDTNQDGTPAFTFEPWSDGHGVGFKVTRHADDKVSYVILNPSQETLSDGKFSPDVFVYTGTSPEVAEMTPHHFYNIDFGDEPEEWCDRCDINAREPGSVLCKPCGEEEIIREARQLEPNNDDLVESSGNTAERERSVEVAREVIERHREPSDDEIANRHGYEGGIPYTPDNDN